MDEKDLNQHLEDILSSSNFKEYKEEQSKFLNDWQYCESADIEPNARFDLDKEAYIKNYYDSAYSIHGEYNEITLLTRLIDNLNNAKHPVWVGYRTYLENRLDKLEKPQQESIFLKNSYEKIFSNDIGFTIFEKWYAEYKNTPNRLAFFSFIYNALNKDKYIICSGAAFVDFLANEDYPYGIVIDKIDSRQVVKGNNKTKHYNSIKTNFQIN